ncbi:fumarylacetoacetate hydrolase family protein [Streptosporangium sp. NPDC002607]
MPRDHARDLVHPGQGEQHPGFALPQAGAGIVDQDVEPPGRRGPALLTGAVQAEELRGVTRLPGSLTSRIPSVSSTNKMIFSAGTTLSFNSRVFTLRPGDIIATGTPSGIGHARTPPWLLHDGDVVEVEVGKSSGVRTPVINTASAEDWA